MRAEAVRRTACHVLPVAPARYEALPVTLAEGSWLVSVGAWVLGLRLEISAHVSADAAVPDGDESPATHAGTIVRRTSEPGEERGRPGARLLRAQRDRASGHGLLLSGVHPRSGRPADGADDVVIALDLSGEGAVSDYKKLLQGFIWKERGHARDLADFLLANGLLSAS